MCLLYSLGLLMKRWSPWLIAISDATNNSIQVAVNINHGKTPQAAATSCRNPSPRFCQYTVKLRYNGLAYNTSSVIAYASSQSRHFSTQNMSVIAYLDVTYPRLLRTDFWAQTLQRTSACLLYTS